MWAPDAACKEGKYYLYFPAKRPDGIFQIGVAVGDHPAGPFVPEPEPIKGSYSIDPAAAAPYLEEADTGEELLIFGDPDLDLSAYLAETTLLAAPLSVLHAPDCLGLCQVCGHDLNEGPCEHRAGVPVEEIDDLLGTPEGTVHAKQTPFTALRDLKLPED